MLLLDADMHADQEAELQAEGCVQREPSHGKPLPPLTSARASDGESVSQPLEPGDDLRCLLELGERRQLRHDVAPVEAGALSDDHTLDIQPVLRAIGERLLSHPTGGQPIHR